MAIKQIVVPLDDTKAGQRALRFAFDHFGNEKNIITILWLGSKCAHPERAIEVQLKYGRAKLGLLHNSYRLILKDILETEYQDIRASIDVQIIDHLSRKQIASFCSYMDILVSNYALFKKFLLPLFETNSTRRKKSRTSCPKLIISDTYDGTDNVVLVKTDADNVVTTVKQFCYVYSGSCEGVQLNILDLENKKEVGGGFNGQKLLVGYLKQHELSPAIYPYAGEKPDQLKKILNLNKNTVWVSPLESTEEMKFLAHSVRQN